MTYRLIRGEQLYRDLQIYLGRTVISKGQVNFHVISRCLEIVTLGVKIGGMGLHSATITPYVNIIQRSKLLKCTKHDILNDRKR
jgi:hypothetical protein